MLTPPSRVPPKSVLRPLRLCASARNSGRGTSRFSRDTPPRREWRSPAPPSLLLLLLAATALLPASPLAQLPPPNPDPPTATTTPDPDEPPAPAEATTEVAPPEAAAPPEPPPTPPEPGSELGPDEFEGTVTEVAPPAAATSPEPTPTPPGESLTDGAPDEAHVVRYYLEQLEVLGNDRTRAETITRSMLLQPGETFRADDERIDQSKVALLATGFFEEVRFSLRRGSRRGWVVFQIHVRERWTLVVENLAFGYTTITPFGGLGVTELNLFGTGSQLSAAFVVGDQQQAYRLRFVDPSFLGSDWSLLVAAQVSDAQDYLGLNGVTSFRADGTTETGHATIDYWRAGGTLGTGVRLSERMRLDLAYRFEWIDADLPIAASYQRGNPPNSVSAPIPLDLLPGQSLVSGFQASFAYDTRDDPFLPTNGMRLRAGVDFAHGVFGSDYSFAKFTVDWAMHFQLPWTHVVTLAVFAGAIVGNAPLFDQFFVGDLSDLIPGRVLDLNFHAYPAHNILGTAIREMQYEDLAAKIAVEYSWPLYRSRTGFLYGLDVFASIGFFSLASATDVELQLPGYAGAEVFPIDLTGDVGFRFDTMIGLFRLSFSNVMGLIPQQVD
ncbi:MAG: BamA/TamA family outer membrane protein [Deltaproteobacteria bacterium]|nr:BamA/TamA family outer membrane protein [Deltaproteobacteria bacterium]